MNQFLSDRLLLQERVNAGIDVHPADWEVAEFEKQAKAISPKKEWTIKGCQECVNALVKFVFDNQDVVIRRETFPKANGKK